MGLGFLRRRTLGVRWLAQVVATVIIAATASRRTSSRTIGGPFVEGTLMTYGPAPASGPKAKAVVEKFRAKNFRASPTRSNAPYARVAKRPSIRPRTAAETLLRSRRRSPRKPIKSRAHFPDRGSSGSTYELTEGRYQNAARSYVMYVWKKDTGGKVTYFEYRSVDMKTRYCSLALSARNPPSPSSSRTDISISQFELCEDAEQDWPVRVSTRSAPSSFRHRAIGANRNQEGRERPSLASSAMRNGTPSRAEIRPRGALCPLGHLRLGGPQPP